MIKSSKILRTLVFATAIVAVIFGGGGMRSAMAQSLLRDAETENFLRELTTPLFEVAGLEPSAVSIYMLNDRSMNAFVAMGQNIFIHSGLILESDDVNQLLAVLAHETGHITGGHIARNSDNAKPATTMALVGMLLGAAAIAAGSADAGMALMMGSQASAQRLYLKYNRAQESSTDEAGARFLEALEVSPEGMVQTFEKFRNQEYVRQVNQDPYVRSHPLSSQRVARFRDRALQSPFYGKPPDPEMERKFQRIKAKLAGYLNRPHVTFLQYPESDTSVIARYGRIYAYHAQLEWDKALAEGESLIAEAPEDPYFQEIVGQIYLESGRVEQSLPYYRRANELLPREPLLLTSLGHALIALEKPAYDQEAMVVLKLAVALDPENDMGWRQLAVAYARNDQMPYASHATAEMLLLHRNYGDAMMHAQRAVDALPHGSPKWLRSQDILLTARAEMPKQEKRRRR